MRGEHGVEMGPRGADYTVQGFHFPPGCRGTLCNGRRVKAGPAVLRVFRADRR